MRGRLQLRIMRRLITDSRTFADKYNREDRLVMFSVINRDNKKRYFKVFSIKKMFKPFFISRDELAFVKLLYMYYRDGDYYIQCWAKGKERGFRTFWDGVITKEKKFFRRRVNIGMKPTIKQKETFSAFGDYVGRYMKTKKPGKWHSF